MNSKNQIVSGGIEVEKHSFTWIIENFDIVRQSEDYIKSQKFTFKAGETLGLTSEWMVKLQTKTEKRERGDDEKWIGCFLSLLKPADATNNHAPLKEEVNAIFGLDISDGYGSSLFRRNIALHNFMKGGRGWPKLLRQDSEQLDDLFNGRLVIKIEIKLCGEPKVVPSLLSKTSNSVDALEKQYKAKFVEKLAQDMSKALDGPSPRSDAQTKVVSKDGVEFEVNRGILAARSPVFEKMFQTAMTESESGVIMVKDISSKIMTIVLHFMYSGNLMDDWRKSDVITELVYAAEKYQLSDLLEFLNKTVASVCYKENVVDLIKMTRKLSLKEAEKGLLEFMKRNTSSYDDMIFFTEVSESNDDGSKTEDDKWSG